MLPLIPALVAATGAIGPPPDPAAILVTAERRPARLGDVPQSVATLSRAEMDARGVRGIEDLARLIPDLRFGRTAGVAGNNGTNIAIRGIASDVGSATTAIYVDDVPIQIRSIGYFSGNPYPRIFDLERVEVLRGPQGTTFGAGAEGGAVRFLTPAPDFAAPFALYARTEASVTRHGAPSGEAGIAVGGTIGPDLAIRASGWLRVDGGTIDRTTPDGATRLDRDIDGARTAVARVAVAWRPLPGLVLTPSVFYQSLAADGRPQAWEGRARATTGIVNREPSVDRFVLPALKAEADLGFATLTANAGLFRRSQSQALDYATYLSTLRSGGPFGSYANKDAGNAVATQTLRQRNATGELRLAGDPAAPLGWTFGLYAAGARQIFANRSGSGRTPGVLSSGYPQYEGRYNLADDVRATDTQRAVYGSVEAAPFPRLRVSAGLRATWTGFAYAQVRDGPTNGGRRTAIEAGRHDLALTPRVDARYRLREGALLYVSAARGFRPAGAQGPVDPAFCGADLATLGLAASPTGYGADSLWSYAAGAKLDLIGGRLFVDAQVYRSDWRHIQQSIRLPRCGFAFVGNLGRAHGTGTDVAIAATLARWLRVGGSIGYDDTRYAADVRGGNGLLIRARGDRIGGPRLTASAYAEARRGAAYLRADYSRAGRGSAANPAAFGYDPGLPPLGAVSFVSMRTGVRRGPLDVSLFVDNLGDTQAPIARAHDAAASPLYFIETYRPRTIGFTTTARY